MKYGGDSNDGTLMRTRTTNRLEPEGLSHDIDPYAESTTAPMRVTSSVEKIVTNEYELMSAPVTSGHGDATHLSGTQDVPGLYAVSSKQETAGDRNKDAAEMVLYAMPDKTRKNRKAGELNYADLDFRGNQSGQRPQRITPVERTVYADLQTTPAKVY
ncbi:uncharacterized protein [Ptychodera flava]|uniref:uncharacterized protein n=1 Tax=Ptychodera flava TaxID=63121 RepID=UPI00396A78C4